MRASLILAIIVSFSSTLAARADVIYTYTVQSINNIDGTYTFDEPTVLTSLTTIPASSFASYTGTPLTQLTIDPLSALCPNVGSVGISHSCVQVIAAPGNNIFTQLFLQQLDSTGTFIGSHSLQYPDSITISQTPEPSSLVLLSTGLLGLIGITYRSSSRLRRSLQLACDSTPFKSSSNSLRNMAD